MEGVYGEKGGVVLTPCVFKIVLRVDFSQPQKKNSNIQFQGRLANRAEQVESGEGQTELPTFTPRLHSENRPNMFFCLFFV